MKTVDPTYKEWMADNLDIDENEVNRLDHYDKDSLAMYRDLYPQAAGRPRGHPRKVQE